MSRDSDRRHVTGSRLILRLRLATAVVVVSIGTLLLLPFAAITACRARHWYRGWARGLAYLTLGICGVRMRVHRDHPWPSTQTVYVSNHPSTLDLFLLVALGLPNARFFLAGYLKSSFPLGVVARLMGTFFTVTQDYPAERVRIFQRADAELRRTGESVYLSPEGARIPGGRLGPFNKGAFHLAASLGAPIQPLYLYIPPEVDPGAGFDIGTGVVDVYVMPVIDTTTWTIEQTPRQRDEVRDRYVQWHRTIREAHGVPAIVD